MSLYVEETNAQEASVPEAVSVSNQEDTARLKAIEDTIKNYCDALPNQRRPTIIVAGKTGVGKSSTINTFFGMEQATVGHYGRGTAAATPYQWQGENETVIVVDLPGLSDVKDADFKLMYAHWAKQADAFIVVINPPRPMDLGAADSVRELLKAGVPGKHIIFGLNKVDEIVCTDDQGRMLKDSLGRPMKVQHEGILGVLNPHHKKAVRKQIDAFLADLNTEFPDQKFRADQIIPYDAVSGWNLYVMLDAVISRMSYTALVKTREAVSKAEKENARKLAEAQQEIDRQEALLKAREKQLSEMKERERKEEEAKIRREQAELDAKKNAMEQVEQEKVAYEQSLVGRFAEGAAERIESFSPAAANLVRGAGQALHNTGVSVGKFFGRLFGG